LSAVLSREEAPRAWLRYLLGGLLLAWLAGFFWFERQVRTAYPPQLVKTDAIVALTGGSGRISRAIKLLQQGQADRLLITGAHPETTVAQLSRQHRASKSLFACCIDIGRAAGDTIGNAAEAAIWVQNRGFASVRLVTSDYHMPRSLMEFRARMTGVTVVPDAVPGPRNWLRLASEYTKFLARSGWLWLRGVS
jgi:uncharacterized SAM-binding protein YcdF (DUF218 family)